MSNPFEILERTCISFSGGRTSGYMLWRILQAHGGRLPDDAVVCFANTGKEDEETLKFVYNCQIHWNVEIVWLEYQAHEDPKQRFKVVNYQTASRNGEPFEAVIRQRQYLPNPVTRFCTAEMKIRTIHKYLKSIGWDDHNENSDWIGIRADEPRRAAKFARERIPLVVAGIGKGDVGNFWKEQAFDLGLPNFNGVTYHGNCDLCFLKGESQTRSLIAEKPERAIWWAKMEALALASKPSGARFRKDRDTYQQMMDYAKDQVPMFDNPDESIDCLCGE